MGWKLCFAFSKIFIHNSTSVGNSNTGSHTEWNHLTKPLYMRERNMVSNLFGDIFEDNPPKCLFWLIVGFFLDFCWNFGLWVVVMIFVRNSGGMRLWGCRMAMGKAYPNSYYGHCGVQRRLHLKHILNLLGSMSRWVDSGKMNGLNKRRNYTDLQ